MKGFLIGVIVCAFAAVMGYVAFGFMGLGGAEGEGSEALGVDQLEGVDSMIKQLVTSVLVAGVIGIIFVVFILPKLAEKFAQFTYSQNEIAHDEPTKLDKGRSLLLQGEFEEAIICFREFIDETEAQDRMAWVEISNIQLDEFEDADAAIATLLEGWEYEDADWDMGDDVNFIFRLAELYQDEKEDVESAAEMYRAVIERYEENEYQVNRARKALLDLGVEA